MPIIHKDDKKQHAKDTASIVNIIKYRHIKKNIAWENKIILFFFIQNIKQKQPIVTLLGGINEARSKTFSDVCFSTAAHCNSWYVQSHADVKNQ